MGKLTKVDSLLVLRASEKRFRSLPGRRVKEEPLHTPTHTDVNTISVEYVHVLTLTPSGPAQCENFISRHFLETTITTGYALVR